MYFSQVDLRPQASRAPGWRGVMRHGYQAHQLVWSLFEKDPGADRDFLFRSQGRGFYLLSHRPPLDGQGVWEVKTKPYSPKLSAGQSLLFSVRVNPVVSRRIPLADGRTRLRRDDIVMAEKWCLKESNQKLPPQPLLVRNMGLAWLAGRAERNGFAFRPEEVTVEGYQQHRFRKPRSGREVRFSTLDLSGRLEVTEPKLFLDMLYSGLGPAKGFGCGLVLIRRADG